jgi:glutaredoxin
MKKQLLLFLVIFITMTCTAKADFYTWEDESGVSHITDYPPPQNLKKEKIKGFEESRKPAEKPPAEKEKKPTITLYTKNNCPECDKAREFLTSRSLTFTEYNMDQDEAAAAKRNEIDNGRDVPFAIFDRNQVYGFSEAVYNRALKTSP